MNTNCNEEIQKTEEPWHHWKTVAGYAYVVICVFDFLIMPIATHTSHAETKALIYEIFEKTNDKQMVLELIDKMKTDQWMPVTMSGGGLFHLSFGAILTGAAVTRGFERREIVKNGNGKSNKVTHD